MEIPNNFNRKDQLYNKYLKEISGIKFTPREISVISCIVHNRGNQNIASLLSITARGVAAHIHNIRTKLNHVPRDAIIDFVEKSGKLQFLKKYYYYLIAENLFEEYLQKISRLLGKEKISIGIKYFKLNEQQTQLLKDLKQNLQKANIFLEENFDKTSQESNITNFNNIRILTKKDEFISNSDNEILLIFDHQLDYQDKPDKNKYIDFNANTNLYLSTLLLVQKLSNSQIISDLVKKYESENQNILKAFAEEGRHDIEHYSGKKSLMNKNTFRVITVIFTVFFIACLFSLYKVYVISTIRECQIRFSYTK